MAGGWRITDDEELVALDRARRNAQEQRTDEAWRALADQIVRCLELGLLDDHPLDQPLLDAG
jgi:hypothetical protein